MRVKRQKLFARGLFTRGTFGRRMKSLYHNTSGFVDRYTSRSAATLAGYPDKVAAEAASNFVLPAVGASVGGPVGTAIATVPVGHAYVLGASKLNKIKVKKDGTTLGDARAAIAKKTFVKTKKAIDKRRETKTMRNLDETKVGQTLARVYKKGSGVYEKTRGGALRFKDKIKEAAKKSAQSAPQRALALRPVHA